METSIEILKLALQIAMADKASTTLKSRLKLPGNVDLLALTLAIDQELRNELTTRAAESKPNVSR